MANKILEEAKRLGPWIAERGNEIEQLRDLPTDIVEAIRPSQAFRMYVPESLGGPGVSAWDGLEVIEEYGYHDGSASWSVAISCTSSVVASFLSEEYAQLIFGDPMSITGGFIGPMGRAREVDGGLRVSGQWSWGSGTTHCTWIGGGCIIVDEDGNPKPRADGLVAPYVLFDPADVEFLDTWHVSGLAGTGSLDYTTQDAFVPEGRWVQFGRDAPLRENPFTNFSLFGILSLGIASTSVGIARRSVAELITLATEKKPQGSSRPLGDRMTVQNDVGKAEAMLRSAWVFLEDTVETAWENATAGNPATDEQKRLLRLAATHATQTAGEVTKMMYLAGGGAAVYHSSPIQRCFRDVFVATQHAMIAPRTFEVSGRMRLGLETDTKQL
ncbi:MAG: flavin-dependent monooxygenase [Actinomycetia bacterium]|nr:flavin-dependent monooxygenase [Actinomycetes bacterium]